MDLVLEVGKTYHFILTGPPKKEFAGTVKDISLTGTVEVLDAHASTTWFIPAGVPCEVLPSKDGNVTIVGISMEGEINL